MKSVALTVFARTALKRTGVKKLRAASRVPAVIYGARRPQAQNLEIIQKELEDLLHHAASESLLVDLSIDGDADPKRLALVQEVQHHPLSGNILHVDLHEIAPDEPVTVTVPVETTGEAVGVKAGGVLEHLLFSLKLRGLPKDLPDQLVIDVSGLEIGDAIDISQIPLPAGVAALSDPSISVVAVAAPRVEEEAVAEAAEAAEGPTEPEVIKEKKEGEAGSGESGSAK